MSDTHTHTHTHTHTLSLSLSLSVCELVDITKLIPVVPPIICRSEKYQPIINNFVQWFNTSQTPGNVDVSTATGAVYKFIGAFMCMCMCICMCIRRPLTQTMTVHAAVLSEYPLPEEHQQIISDWLLSTLVRPVYPNWFSLYCTTSNVCIVQYCIA
jgi:hypothetical protein